MIGDMDLENLKKQYQNKNARLADLEAQIEQEKKARSDIAKEILDGQGDKPFDFEGKQVTVACMKGTYFLRVPFGGRKKAAPEPHAT
jgi:hypothetical protein